MADVCSVVAAEPLSLVLLFASSEYRRDALAGAVRAQFGRVPVIGCTTAGELGPAGCSTGGLVAIGFPASGFTAVTGTLEGPDAMSPAGARALGERLRGALDARPPRSPGEERFAVLLTDGMSRREELIGPALYAALDYAPLVGGSAGDDLHFERTFVLADGELRSDAAVAALVSTTQAMRPFLVSDCAPGEERLVVTEADAERRVVAGLNGRPAAGEYARVIGVAPSALAPDHFALHPVMVLVEGTYYARSIQRVNPDGSLTFHCALDEGVVLRVARAVDPAGSLERALERLTADLGEVALVLAFECMLFRSAAQPVAARFDQLVRARRVAGFRTYGEQYCGVHVNQTVTGLAFGAQGAAT